MLAARPGRENASEAAAPQLVEIWLSGICRQDARLYSILGPDELVRLGRIRSASTTAQFLFVHALLRLVLAQRLGCNPADLTFERSCPRCGGPHGKPRLSSTCRDLDFSIARTGDLVCVALTSGTTVGVDIERLQSRPGPTTGNRLALTEQEREALRRGPAADRSSSFLAYWTRKEAVLKCTGLGLLHLPPFDFEVPPPEEDPSVISLPREGNARKIFLKDLSLPEGYVGAVATNDAPARVCLRNATDIVEPYLTHRVDAFTLSFDTVNKRLAGP